MGVMFRTAWIDNGVRAVVRWKSSLRSGKQSEGFQYKPGREFNSFSMFSGTSFYDRSSFAVELPNMREKASLELWRLRDQVWLDDSTRALYITFNLLNTNYYCFSSVKNFA